MTRLDSPVSYRFPKSEKLTSKKDIEELFRKGSSFFIYPIRIKFVKSTEDLPYKVLIVAPKKNLKRASDRNKIKRRISESFRLQLPIVRERLIGISFAIIYSSPQVHEYNFIDGKLRQALVRLTTFENHV